MNKQIKQLNRFLAIFLLASVLPLVTAGHANAGFMDWFSGTENEASASQTFGSFTSFLSVADLIANTELKKQDLPLLQNSSLLSVSSPLATKVTAEIKSATVKNIMTVLATAYSSTPDQTDDSPFITAMGTRVRDGIVAANFLPFGTRIRLPELYGDKVFVVEDRMNRRYWHVVDVWFPDRASAKEFGVKRVTIQILES
jgi:3D (Asp-Asp-Asp) domain-containing protein